MLKNSFNHFLMCLNSPSHDRANFEMSRLFNFLRKHCFIFALNKKKQIIWQHN